MDVRDLAGTGRGLARASSTHGAGKWMDCAVRARRVLPCIYVPHAALHSSRATPHRGGAGHLLPRLENADCDRRHALSDDVPAVASGVPPRDGGGGRRRRRGGRRGGRVVPMASLRRFRLRPRIRGESGGRSRPRVPRRSFSRRATHTHISAAAPVHRSHLLSHSDRARRKPRRATCGGASRADGVRHEAGRAATEKQETPGAAAIPDAPLRLLSGGVRRRNAQAQVAAHPVLRVADGQHPAEHGRLRGGAGVSPRVSGVGAPRAAVRRRPGRRGAVAGRRAAAAAVRGRIHPPQSGPRPGAPAKGAARSRPGGQ